MIIIEGTKTIEDLQNEVFEAVNQTGGLKLGKIDEDSEDELEDDDIDIPVPSFDTVDQNENDKTLDSKGNGSVKTKLIDPKSITFALPADKNNPLSGRWILLDDSSAEDNSKKRSPSLLDLQIVNDTVLAFKIGDEDFYVQPPKLDYND